MTGVQQVKLLSGNCQLQCQIYYKLHCRTTKLNVFAVNHNQKFQELYIFEYIEISVKVINESSVELHLDG